MRQVATTAKGTPVYLIEAASGGYAYLAGDKRYKIIRNDMIGAMKWICAYDGPNGWYSDPFWTKHDAFTGLLETLNHQLV